MLNANTTYSGLSIGIPRAAATRGNDNNKTVATVEFRMVIRKEPSVNQTDPLPPAQQ